MPRLTRLYNSCSALAPVDPSFGAVAEPEIADLVGRSMAASDGFRLQVIGHIERGEVIGYYHLTHRAPRPETTWVSMFVLGATWHGTGLGGEVATGLVDEVRRLEWCRAVWLRVYLGNVVALRHWVGAGFRRIVEVRTGQTDTGREPPSVVLECILDPTHR